MHKKINMTRRIFTAGFGAAISCGPILGLLGCNSDSDSSTTSTTTEDDSSDDTSNEKVTEDVSTDETGSLTWASGGTDLITQDYPQDTLFESASLCALQLTERTTEGPCYLGVSERDDISEGQTGLPMMLCLQVVDQDCNPLEGYLVEVWHCNREGIYSGDENQSDDTSTFAGGFCTGNDQEAENSTWFRGEQTTDSSGRVNFKSCFPGWYSGRTIHIHFRVRLEYGGSDYIVSQFCFDDALCDDICTSHDLYVARGEQDTPLSGGRDTVFPDTDYENFLMNVQQYDNGVLLGYKRIMIDV
jgi:protocatechuate 3,4-dioxygenase beta subunit